MSIALWIVTAILCLGFLAAGTMKATQPLSRLTAHMPWTQHVPAPLVRVIGVCEALGAIGLVVPPLTGILPVLALVAACCLAAVQLCAIVFHLRRGEVKGIGVNVVLLCLCLFVACCRLAGIA